MVTFDLKGSAIGDEPGCTIHPGRYPKEKPTDPDQVGWQVLSARGEPLGQPTVNLWDPPVFPAAGCVFVKVTREYRGWLESLIDAGLVEPTGREEGAGFVERYAVECRVLNPELLKVAS
jgi:hypothetical protein